MRSDASRIAINRPFAVALDRRGLCAQFAAYRGSKLHQVDAAHAMKKKRNLVNPPHRIAEVVGRRLSTPHQRLSVTRLHFRDARQTKCTLKRALSLCLFASAKLNFVALSGNNTGAQSNCFAEVVFASLYSCYSSTFIHVVLLDVFVNEKNYSISTGVVGIISIQNRSLSLSVRPCCTNDLKIVYQRSSYRSQNRINKLRRGSRGGTGNNCATSYDNYYGEYKLLKWSSLASDNQLATLR